MSDREAIGVIGAGWVGLCTAACFAELGHEVWCRDIVREKVDALSRGDVPIFEPGLPELVEKNRERLHFTTDMSHVLENTRLLFCCVDTPPTYSGDADLSRVERVVQEVGESPDHALVMKSTVPVGTGRSIRRRANALAYVSNPEFLKEGTAVHDFMNPDRVVVGAADGADHFADRVVALYEPLNAPIVRTDVESAEMIKLASNAFLATKISFINEIANVSEELGADVTEVARGMGLDERIGPQFLRAGIGYGGSCLVGEETVLVRRQGRVWIWTLAEMWERVAEEQDYEVDETDVLDPEELEVLSWRSASERPEFLPVSHLTRRAYEGDILEVRTTMGRRVRCTPDHPFVVADGQGHELGVKEARDLGEADWLPVAQGAPAVERERQYMDPLALSLATESGEPSWITRTVAGQSRTLAEPQEAGQAVPDEIWRQPESVKRAFLAAMWKEGGSWSFLASARTVALEYATASRGLADSMLRLLGELGVMARWKVGRAPDAPADNWLVIEDQVESLLDFVRPDERDEIRASLRRQKKRIAPTGYRRHGGNAGWVRVTEKRAAPFAGHVYSLEIPDAHTLVTTGGLVGHQCFPKDVSALKQLAGNTGYHFQLLTAVIEVNELQKRRTIGKLQKNLGSLVSKEIALLGLAFKPNTDDIREATSLVLAARLQSEGAHVRAYDPVAADRASEMLGGAKLAGSALEALDGADAVVLVTEWPEFRDLDWAGEVKQRMNNPLVVDGRNFLDGEQLRAAGFTYEGVGR